MTGAADRLVTRRRCLRSAASWSPPRWPASGSTGPSPCSPAGAGPTSPALIEDGRRAVGGRPVAKSRRLAEGEEVEVDGRSRAPRRRPRPEPVDFPSSTPTTTSSCWPSRPGLVVHPGAGHTDGHAGQRAAPPLPRDRRGRRPDAARDRPPPRPRHQRPHGRGPLAARPTTPWSRRWPPARSSGATWPWPGAASTPPGARSTPPSAVPTSRRTRMAVREAGKEARTGYEVLSSTSDPVCALVECRLETGRTHQIRVHLRGHRPPGGRRRAPTAATATRSGPAGRSSTPTAGLRPPGDRRAARVLRPAAARPAGRARTPRRGARS